MATNDFLTDAPPFIVNRFNSISKYVWDSLYSDPTFADSLSNKKQIERRRRLAQLKSVSNEASTVIFLFLLNKFFVEGANAAKKAVDTFKELDVDGFYIGRNYFSGRNDKVLQGDKISAALLDTIQDEEAKKLIVNSNFVSEILEKYKKHIK